jgi:HAE1 family hydrophobic/amphiphilic exporter-1
VKRKLPELRRKTPPDVEIGISVDYSMFIRDDIEEVQNALLLGIVLTALVTFIFLGSLGTTMNVCVSIPTSLIGTFMAMKWCGFTINFMTLLALSLSVGVVVDDAILVLENIYRRLEHGEPRREAALKGARQISFAALAATLSIVAIFVPVAFMKGSIGQFFFQFGITVTVAVLLSLVISLTITPVLCAFFLSVRRMKRPAPAAYSGSPGGVMTVATRSIWFIDRWVFEPILLRPVDWIMRASAWLYGKVLGWSLRHRGIVVACGLLIAGSAGVFAFGLKLPLPEFAQKQLGKQSLTVKPIGRELVPSEDQNRFVVSVICPVGSNFDYVNEMLHKGESVLASIRDPVTDEEVVATFFASVSIRPGTLISEGIMFVRLVPPVDANGNRLRTLTQNQIMNEVRKGFATTPGVRIITQDLSTQGFTPRRGFPVNFAVQGPDWETVTELSERIRERMIDSGVVADVNSDYRPGMAELQIVPDKVKAAEMGVPMRRLALVINVAVGGMRSGRFSAENRRYDVRMRLLEDQRDSPDDLGDLYVKSETTGRLIPLRDLTQRKLVSTLPVINRYNHLRKVELSANPAPGIAQGEAITHSLEVAEQVRDEMGLPPSYRFVMLGNAQAMEQTLDSLWVCLALGFVIAAMILGAQFNSFVHPFTVLMAVPFGVTGALATLYFSGDTLNMMSMIGMILLAGLVKKNSIILVDYINHLRRDGMPLFEAVLKGSPVRLRPIVMTTFATVAGAIPLAIGVGAGAETRAPLARSIIGGSILSTLITLIIVPVLYVLFEQFADWLRRTARGEVETEAQEPSSRVASVATITNGVYGHSPRSEVAGFGS